MVRSIVYLYAHITAVNLGLGFAAFFSIFEVSRRVASATKNYIETSQRLCFVSSNATIQLVVVPFLNSAVLVTGGVSCDYSLFSVAMFERE